MLPRPPAAVPRTGAPASGQGLRPARAAALARDAFGREIDEPPPEDPSQPSWSNEEPAKPPRETATDAIGRRAGALSDELDFPEFVASLVHGTFDAIVDSSIRQMESFADLVAAVAKPVDQFTQENVSLSQARDWLIEQYPQDLTMVRDADGPHVVPRPSRGAEGEAQARTPDWLADFAAEGEELTPELIEEQLVPLARERVARNRLQTLATMVLLGMNRVVVRDGTIGARLRFRAAAADHTRVDYAVGDDGNQPPQTEWGRRGSRTYDAPRTMVSTVGVNVQSDSELKAELFGEVKINFASETVPLDRFVDDARRNVLERNARPREGTSTRTTATSPAPAPTAGTAPAPAATAPVAPAPALPAPAAPAVSSAPAATAGAVR
jgi:hypothetical protein